MIIEVNPSSAGDVATLSARKQDMLQNAQATFSLSGWVLDSTDNLYKQTVQIGQEILPEVGFRNFVAVYNYPSVIASPSEESFGLATLNDVSISSFARVADALSYSVTASATEPPESDVTFTFIIYGSNDTAGALITDTTEAFIRQNSIGYWDETFTYSEGDFCMYNGEIYKSVSDNNLNNVPGVGTAYWTIYSAMYAPAYDCVMNYSMDATTKIYSCTYAGTIAGWNPVDTSRNGNVEGSWNASAAFLREMYPCLLDQDGNEFRRLKYNDITKDVDGNDVSEYLYGGQYDVMVHMPSGYLYQSAGTIAYSSDDVHNVGYKEGHLYGDDTKQHLYIGMFPITVVSNVAHSWCKDVPANGVIATSNSNTGVYTYDTDKTYYGATTNVSRANFRNYAKAKNVNTTGWHLMNFGEYKLLQALELIVTRSFSPPDAVGRGIDSGGQAVLAANGANGQAGWFAGVTANGNNPVKIFVENPYANRWQHLDDIVVDSGANSGVVIDNVYYVNIRAGHNAQTTASATSTITDTVDANKPVVGAMPIGSSASAGGNGYYDKIVETQSGWGIPNALGGTASATTGVCDGHWYNGSAQRLYLVGGDSGSGQLCGPFAVTASTGLILAYWYIGARLAYVR